MFNDQRLEQMIGLLLRAGVFLSAAVVLVGGIGYLVQHGGATPDYRVFRSEPQQYRDPAGIAMAAIGGDWRAVIQFGLLLLIATPVARVALSIVGFAIERDRMYVIVTAIVLAVLLISLTGKI